ncbi:hypothetical protein [Marixanthomonas ophiurae]|uniref:Uncharacterized protein n=1 Tax=Marixanthomonas ophiurae TaxID=387659 RepID=A0A3E1Q6C3_9FLAO|nr:hypothetical protein [Marixanthomonas ophiurae]RFN57685.1 hypothetical protein DZ858_10560 [Marixanthomonas ophiurae]
MKTLYIILGLFFLNLSTTSYAQISVFDIVEDAKKERGDATDNAEEDADAKKMKEGMQKFFGGVNELEDLPMEIKCLTLMKSHQKRLLTNQKEIDNTKGCKKTKDLLEMQALLVLSAGTQIYCPDEFNTDKEYYGRLILKKKYAYLMRSGYNSEELGKAFYVLQKTSEEFGNPYSKIAGTFPFILKELHERWMNDPDSGELDLDTILKIAFKLNEEEWNDQKEEYFSELIDYITYFHSPEFMAKRSGEINSLTQSLPCE